MSKLFNRKNADVIKFAQENTEAAFIKQYSETTATETVLKKAYKEINKSATAKKGTQKEQIAANSTGAANEPLKPVYYAMDEDGELKKVDTTGIPTRTDLDDAEFNENGTVKKAPGEKYRPIKPSADQGEDVKKGKAKKDDAKPAKKETSKQPAKKNNDGKPSKRDEIRALIAANAKITNKEIKAALVEKGFKSCYDSEIAACR